jgi:hypothetical protein
MSPSISVIEQECSFQKMAVAREKVFVRQIIALNKEKC